MDPRYWTKSVELELEGASRVHTVRSTHQAAAVLAHWPPGQQGEAYEEAKRLCRAVLKNGAPRQIARDAFIRAAEEAGIYIRKK
jgi:hypothetical protein